jgi:prophage antirepressor-like protein
MEASGTVQKNQVVTFNFQGNQIRTIEENSEYWFVAKDCCDVLGIANPTQAVNQLDEDEVAMFYIGTYDSKNTFSGNKETNFVSESGLYTLIIRSNKEIAKPFRRWVTHEVLPAIHRKGVYRTENIGHTGQRGHIKTGGEMRIEDLPPITLMDGASHAVDRYIARSGGAIRMKRVYKYFRADEKLKQSLKNSVLRRAAKGLLKSGGSWSGLYIVTEAGKEYYAEILEDDMMYGHALYDNDRYDGASGTYPPYRQGRERQREGIASRREDAARNDAAAPRIENKNTSNIDEDESGGGYGPFPKKPLLFTKAASTEQKRSMSSDRPSGGATAWCAMALPEEIRKPMFSKGPLNHAVIPFIYHEDAIRTISHLQQMKDDEDIWFVRNYIECMAQLMAFAPQFIPRMVKLLAQVCMSEPDIWKKPPNKTTH